MILKHIYTQIFEPLHSGIPDLSVDYTYRYKLRSRHVFNFIEREIFRKIRFESEGFNQITIDNSTVPHKHDFYVNSSKVCECYINFDKEMYDSLQISQFSEYYGERLLEGLKLGANYTDLPVKEVSEGIESLRRNNFSNSWVQDKRSFRGSGVKASLECSLSLSDFKLSLVVEKEGEQVFSEVILQTDPDEIAFESKFKKLSYVGENLSVLDRFGETLFELNTKNL